MILNWKNLLVSMVYTQIFQGFDGYIAVFLKSSGEPQ